MTSTVLDATLCLLLVSAGAVSLATTSPAEPAERPRADAAAETLAASTAAVNYTLPSSASRDDPRGSHSEPHRAVDRTAQGTLAGLLADATVGNATLDGRRLSHASDDFRRETERATTAAVGTNGSQVVAVWYPYGGADLRARVTVGTPPPPGTDVHAATFTVDSGLPEARVAARSASDAGFGAVARIVAVRTVEGLFPPDRTRDVLGGDDPDAALARHRYRRAGDLFGADASVAHGRSRAANERLAASLARRFERDLRREYDSPLAAARSVRVGRVRITVRTWSR